MKIPTPSKRLVQAVDDFLTPQEPPTTDVFNSVMNALDERETEVRAMLKDFYQPKATGKYDKQTKQVNRKAFGGKNTSRGMSPTTPTGERR
jgi:hypothetical protein